MILTLILSLLLTTKYCLTSEEHAIYIALIEIEDLEKEDSLQVRIKVFTDDLENALRTSPDYQSASESIFCEINRMAINQYFKDHLLIRLNDGVQALEYLRGEWIGDTYWLSFNIRRTKWDDLYIDADFLMEIYPTQQNIVTVNRNGIKKSCRLNLRKSSCTLNYTD
jgi:hypothetical protein